MHSKGQFRYFEDADDDGNGTKQKGFIDLREVQQVTNDKEVLLIVMNTGRIFELVAESAQEAALWSSFLRKELTDCGVELPEAGAGGIAAGAGDGEVAMRLKKKKSMMSRLSREAGVQPASQPASVIAERQARVVIQIGGKTVVDVGGGRR